MAKVSGKIFDLVLFAKLSTYIKPFKSTYYFVMISVKEQRAWQIPNVSRGQNHRLFFVEVMGRDAGHIALNTGIGAGAEEILIPEENMGLNRLLESLDRSEKSGKSSSIVVIAEGGKTGKNVFEIAEYVEKNMPHYEVRVSVLGHIQRGGSPSCFDRVLASRMGVHAIESLQKGESNVMVGVNEDQMILTSLDKAIKGKSEINKNLIRVSDILSI